MNKSISIAFLIMFMGWGSALAQTDYDCFIGEQDGVMNFYERQNSGAGSMSFSAVTGGSDPFDGEDVGDQSAPAFVDIDNDGDQDCFIGAGDGTMNYYRNTGSSSSAIFVEQTGGDNPFNSVDVGSKSQPAFVDIDGDGDYDCFIGEYHATINYYKNNGNSSAPDFDLVTGSDNPLNGATTVYDADATFVDIDGDGDQDCFIGDYYGNILYYKNTGNSSSATFTAQTGGNNPFNGVSVFNYSRLRFFDVDGDGDQDCFIGVNDGTIDYFRNTGNSSSATFVEQTGDDNPFDGVDVGGRASPAFVNIDGDASLPVELTSFHVLSIRSQAVTLQWVTESEINNLGFILDRRVPGTEWTEIATYITHPELQGQGSVTHQTIYSYTDNTVLSAETYDYRLADVDYDGNKVYHSMTVMGVSPNDVVPETFTLYPAYPNPFNPTTNIRYDLPENALVNITIYDIMGRSIRSLVNSKQTAGYRSIQWNATNDAGSPVSAGLYLYTIQAGEFRQTRKMVLLK